MCRVVPVDLSRPIGRDTQVYPGDPAPLVAGLARADRDGYETRLLVMGDHTGTHMDAPSHFYPGSDEPADIPIERLVAPGIALDLSYRPPRSSVGEAELEAALRRAGARRGDFVLLRFGWDRVRGPEWLEYPELSLGAAEALVRLGVAGLGLDTPSPDREPYPVHKLLLSRGIVILENLVGLERLVGRRFLLVVGALPVRGATGAPARVVALLFEGCGRLGATLLSGGRGT